MSALRDCTIPVDPTATAMKMYSVPRGMQFIINIDGSQDRLEIVNPTDGRLPFFRLHTVEHTSEEIEFEPSDIRSHRRTQSPSEGSARPQERSAGDAHEE